MHPEESMANGGRIEGPSENSSDVVLAQLDSGYVIPQRIAEKHGWDFLKAINDEGAPGDV